MTAWGRPDEWMLCSHQSVRSAVIGCSLQQAYTGTHSGSLLEHAPLRLPVYALVTVVVCLITARLLCTISNTARLVTRVWKVISFCFYVASSISDSCRSAAAALMYTACVMCCVLSAEWYLLSARSVKGNNKESWSLTINWNETQNSYSNFRS